MKRVYALALAVYLVAQTKRTGIRYENDNDAVISYAEGFLQFLGGKTK